MSTSEELSSLSPKDRLTKLGSTAIFIAISVVTIALFFSFAPEEIERKDSANIIPSEKLLKLDDQYRKALENKKGIEEVIKTTNDPDTAKEFKALNREIDVFIEQLESTRNLLKNEKDIPSSSFHFGILSNAYADDGGGSKIDKTLIIYTIFGVLVFIYVIAVLNIMFSSKPESIEFSRDVEKRLTGFFIGSIAAILA